MLFTKDHSKNIKKKNKNNGIFKKDIPRNSIQKIYDIGCFNIRLSL